jgi:hypothetical protein
MAMTKALDKGYLADPKPAVVHDYIRIDDRVHRIHKLIVHRFRMGDVDDPDLYAAQPLWEWQESEMGKWVMARAVDTPEWHRQNHQFLLWGYEYIVVAKLKDTDYTFWQLKWGLTVDTN